MPNRKFLRRNTGSLSRLGKLRRKLQKWRKPKGRDNKMRLKEKEKELDQILKSKEQTVAERTQQGTKLCRTCDGTIPYSQATKSFSIYREYYCQDHEPKL